MTKEEIIVASANGGELPDGLDPADTFLFMALRSLYAQAKHGDMSKEQGAREKNAIIKQHEKMKLWVRVAEEHRRKDRDFQGAWNEFAKDPTIENADNLHRAWFRCGIKIAENSGDNEQEGDAQG